MYINIYSYTYINIYNIHTYICNTYNAPKCVDRCVACRSSS